MSHKHHIIAKTINHVEATNELKKEVSKDLKTKEPSKAEAYDMLMKAFGSGNVQGEALDLMSEGL
ncbi:hypothetical protein KAR91_47135 [Candidatus Pacearchaeota archaeon]|nr:hypothetical protein [Candidatus Pacearchaeota archaeon]